MGNVVVSGLSFFRQPTHDGEFQGESNSFTRFVSLLCIVKRKISECEKIGLISPFFLLLFPVGSESHPSFGTRSDLERFSWIHTYICRNHS